MTDDQREFVRELTSADEGGWRAFETFLDLSTSALAARSGLNDRDRHEAEYRATAARVGAGAVERSARLLAIAVRGLSAPHDFLGPIAGDDRVQSLNRHLGQFFTPFEVCRLLALMTLQDARAVLADRGCLRIGEPACGSGAMVLAAAAVLQAQEVSPADVWFECADLSSLAVSMAYVQMSLAGLAGEVCERNSLTTEPPRRRLFTFRAEAFLARYPYRPRPARAVPEAVGQMELFT